MLASKMKLCGASIAPNSQPCSLLRASSCRSPFAFASGSKTHVAVLNLPHRTCSAADGILFKAIAEHSEQLTVLGVNVPHSSVKDAKEQDLVAVVDGQGNLAIVEAIGKYDRTSQTLLVARKGQTYTLTASPDAGFQMVPAGVQLRAASTLVKSIPGWATQLQQQLADPATVPATLGLSSELVDAACVYSLASLHADVLKQPGRWCDGTGPGDAEPSTLEYAVMSGGELSALLAGHRGIALVQLVIGWDRQVMWSGTIYNPLVPTLLAQALADPELLVIPSVAAGGLGLTAIVCTKREPWRSWAKHMAGLGVQAGIVAGSPFYKLLIGRMLGYKEANIVNHIQGIHDPREPSAAVIAAVEAELRGLSGTSAKLPWSRSTRKKKVKQ